jgi:homoserine kinase
MSKAGSGFDICGGCQKLYMRLSTNISQNALCTNHYTNRADKTSSVATTQNSCPTTNNSQLFSSPFNQERHSSPSGRKAPASKKE